MRLPLPPCRLFETYFRKFLMSPKGPPFILLIFCNRTNVKKFKRVSSFRFFGTMRLKNSHFVENFPNGPPSIFLNYRKRMDVKKSQRTPPFHSFRPCEIFKSNNFCLKVRFSQAQHAISDFFFKDCFSYATFSIFFIEIPPQFLPKMKRFVTLKDSSSFSALCDFKKIAGVLQKNFSKIFWKNFGKFLKKNFLQFSVF